METYEKSRNNNQSTDRRVIPDRRLFDDIMAGYERRNVSDRRKDSSNMKQNENGK